MHEYAVTESILEIVKAEVRQAGGGRVSMITVVIGELTSFASESIEFYFETLARGTVAEGAWLEFRPLEAIASCGGCGGSFTPGPRHVLLVCPDCGSAAYDFVQGKEFYIESIEVSA
ncbi:MAG: hydrogenase maturation nickel metallochaperone HypA [Thermoleophilia bacterium]|nr:hydrogenase maturation nickel metallochaperone HypA [Thermoleophilia bacterium]